MWKHGTGPKCDVDMAPHAENGVLTKKQGTGSNSSYDKKIHKSTRGFVEYAPHFKPANSVKSALTCVPGNTFQLSLKIDLSSEVRPPNGETEKNGLGNQDEGNDRRFQSGLKW